MAATADREVVGHAVPTATTKTDELEVVFYLDGTPVYSTHEER